MWEDGKRPLNPMAGWSWSDITAYADAKGVPVNEGHNYAYRAQAPIEATKRHLPDLPWQCVWASRSGSAQKRNSRAIRQSRSRTCSSPSVTSTPLCPWSPRRASAQAAS
eukprot:TRINITY_DN13210_c0_g1_i1.p1 TRINITY_DN13210_c0_g1~~TRINITY_DN13210_c0_g1_i1.p1  ORF type:complete len:124 (+),score=7.72 TRINITY_DN13210_c0_g1_i1:46-372(+)